VAKSVLPSSVLFPPPPFLRTLFPPFPSLQTVALAQEVGTLLRIGADFPFFPFLSLFFFHQYLSLFFRLADLLARGEDFSTERYEPACARSAILILFSLFSSLFSSFFLIFYLLIQPRSLRIVIGASRRKTSLSPPFFPPFPPPGCNSLFLHFSPPLPGNDCTRRPIRKQEYLKSCARSPLSSFTFPFFSFLLFPLP